MSSEVDRVAEGRRLLHPAAMSIIATDGLAGLTSARLAARAGLSRRFVGRCYSSPALCLTATYERVSGEVIADLAEAANAPGTVHETLRRVLHRLLEHMDAAPSEARLCFREILLLGRAGICHHAAVADRIVRLLCGSLAATAEEPLIEPVQVELLVAAVFDRLAVHQREDPRGSLLALESELVRRAGAIDPVAV